MKHGFKSNRISQLSDIHKYSKQIILKKHEHEPVGGLNELKFTVWN